VLFRSPEIEEIRKDVGGQYGEIGTTRQELLCLAQRNATATHQQARTASDIEVDRELHVRGFRWLAAFGHLIP
jgi:hypothetical protein